MTFYEVTGRVPSQAQVWIRKFDDNYKTNWSFRDFYAERVPAMRNKNFDPTISSNDDYNVVEVKGVNEARVLDYLKEQANRYGPGLERYPYNTINNNCARFNYNAYRAGGIEFTPEPGNWFENPMRYPRDLNEAIEYHNQIYDFENQFNWNLNFRSNPGGGINFNFGWSGGW